MERYAYPHTIENGGGERLTFLRRVSGPTGDRLEVQNCVSPRVGPPLHTHHYQVESLTVVRGRIGYQRQGAPAQYAGPGETVTLSAGGIPQVLECRRGRAALHRLRGAA